MAFKMFLLMVCRKESNCVIQGKLGKNLVLKLYLFNFVGYGLKLKYRLYFKIVNMYIIYFVI